MPRTVCQPVPMRPPLSKKLSGGRDYFLFFQFLLTRIYNHFREKNKIKKKKLKKISGLPF